MLSQRDPIRGFLVSDGLDPEILVEFQFNPTEISDQRQVNYTSLTAPGLLMPIRQYTQGGDRKISFRVRVDGLFETSPNALRGGGQAVNIQRDDNGGITPELNKYRAFLYPQTADWQSAAATFTSRRGRSVSMVRFRRTMRE